jgi:large exoprotein involved in heme utilization and adhesion
MATSVNLLQSYKYLLFLLNVTYSDKIGLIGVDANGIMRSLGSQLITHTKPQAMADHHRTFSEPIPSSLCISS